MPEEPGQTLTARLRIDVITAFPEYLAPLDLSLIGRARRAGRVEVHTHDLRDWASDRHRTIDDTPFGGGAGMVMRPDVWGAALDAVITSETHLIIPTPSGEVFTQRHAEQLATESHLVFACGRYEGIDARVAEHYRKFGPARVSELSIGDYVLSGGEAATLVMVEATARLLPLVLGNPESLVEESHAVTGLLEYPGYTKPAEWRAEQVPPILISGHHVKIARWRRDQAIRLTAKRRPDLLAKLPLNSLDASDLELLATLGWQPVAQRLTLEPKPVAQ